MHSYPLSLYLLSAIKNQRKDWLTPIVNATPTSHRDPKKKRSCADDPYQLIALSVQTNPCDVTELKFSFRAVIRNKTNPIG